MPDISDLRQRQSLPLRAKVLMSQSRIREWYNYWQGAVYVSFSGGKDSTVLAHLVHDLYPEVPLVFCNTGLELPEIQAFARKMGAEFIRPKMSFSEVISTYGYPIISKENSEAIYYARRIKEANKKRETIQYKRLTFLHDGKEIDRRIVQLGDCSVRRDLLISGNGKNGEENADQKSIFNRKKYLPLCQETQFLISHKCCDVMKKSPLGIYQRQKKIYPILGTLAEESKLREQAWIRHGCNSFEGTKKKSVPLSPWLEQDILRYIVDEGLEIASVYGDIVAVDPDGMEYDPHLSPGPLKCTGCQRTGCAFCAFGAHLEKGETRFQRLAKTHPKQYEYCIEGGAVGRQSVI